MAVDDPSESELRRQASIESIKRVLASIPPPPMQVIHQGWFRDRVELKTVDEIQAERKRKGR